MLDILDQVIESTNGNGTIVSENHDVNSINWVAGVMDPGEMIRCGYMPEIRRRANEQDAEYQARIQPIINRLPEDQKKRIMGAAIKRASLDVSGDRVRLMVAGKPAWHNLGVLVNEAVNSKQAIQLAGMDVEMLKVPMGYTFNGKQFVSDTYAIVRGDNGAQLGKVGGRYQIIQNADAFSFMDDVLAAHGAKYESAGMLYGGRKVFMLARLPKQSFTLKGDDAVEAYALFTNTHDGSSVGEVFPTSERVECANTLRIARRKGAGKALKIRHTGDIKNKIAAAREALGLVVSGFETFKDNAEVLTRTSLVEPNAYFDGVLDLVLDMTKADAVKGADALAAAIATTEAEQEFARRKFAREIQKRQELFDDILNRYEEERCGKAERGTAWSALNAITESVDHGKAGGNFRGEGKESRKFESLIAGAGDQIKQVAFAQAMNLARV